MIYLKLFIAFLQIAAFSFGGGYAAMPLIEHNLVDVNGWLTIGEFTDLLSISEMTPGPIAVNAATFAGIKIAGFPGALAATFGCILPSCIICSILAFLYYRYKNFEMLKSILNSLRPAVVALIASAGLSVLKLISFKDEINLNSVNYLAVVIFALSFFVLRKFKINPIFVMLCCGILYLIINIVLIKFDVILY